MRKLLLLSITIFLVVGCGDYSGNDEIVSRIKFDEIFKNTFSDYGVKRNGGSQSIDSESQEYEQESFYIVSGSKPFADKWLGDYVAAIKKELLKRGAKVNTPEKLAGIQYGDNYKTLAPDSFAYKLSFSIDGSLGLIHMRYTTVKNDKSDTIGYLSLYMFEHRQ